MHPAALLDGAVAAHELTHSLQAQCNIDYRATMDWALSGSMRAFSGKHTPISCGTCCIHGLFRHGGMDVFHIETWGDWKNTYENYPLLFAIMESEGIGMVNRLWRESYSWEYPLQAYKRLAGYNQTQCNDSLFLYARRMATFDFNYNNLGTFFRQYRNADLMYQLPSAPSPKDFKHPKAPGHNSKSMVICTPMAAAGCKTPRAWTIPCTSDQQRLSWAMPVSVGKSA